MPKTTKVTIAANKTTVTPNVSPIISYSNALNSETDAILMGVTGSGTAFTISGSVAAADYAAYASSSDVANLCRSLLSGASAFNTSTSPTLSAVNSWLSSGCSIIESTLNSLGYDTPVAVGTVARDWLMHLNALFAAAYAEMSRLNITVATSERTRGQLYLEQFNRSLQAMSGMDLSAMGVTQSSGTMSMFIGGISVADKETYHTDSDRVAPRFFRGMFDMPDTIQPTEG